MDAERFRGDMMAVNEHFERERLMMDSIRKKVQSGLRHSKRKGFQSLQDALIQEDKLDDGFLPVHTFKKIVALLTIKLTTAEQNCLISRLKGKRPSGKNDVPLVEYDQILQLLSIDLGEDWNSSDSDTIQDHIVLGSKVLETEQRVRAFILDEYSDIESSSRTVRGIDLLKREFKQIDKKENGTVCGKLDKSSFRQAFENVKLSLTNGELSTILCKFPRDDKGYISYHEFLKRYTSSRLYRPKVTSCRLKSRKAKLLASSPNALPLHNRNSIKQTPESSLSVFLTTQHTWGTTGKDAALKAFKAADQTRNNKLTGYITTRDFGTVLHTIGLHLSPDSASKVRKTVKKCTKEENIDYAQFLRLSCKVPLPKGDLTQWLDSTASEKDKKSLKSFFKALQDFKKSSSDQNTIMYHVAPTLDAQVVFRVTEL